MEDPEIAVYDAELYYSEKYEEWLVLRKKQFQLYPNNETARFRYAEALFQTEKYDDALNYLAKFHRDNPEDDDLNQLILETLGKMNLTKDDFQWTLRPKSLSLNKDLEMMIIDKFKSKRKRKKGLNEIYLDLLIGNLMEFNETELLSYLKKSEYFEVEGDRFYDAIVERKK